MHDETRTHPPADPEATRTSPAASLGELATRTGLFDSSAATRNYSLSAPDGYSIEAELGRGGMGVVYKATQLKLNRTVALKMILTGRATGSRELNRFLAEAEAVAAVDHPHVVRVYDSGDAGGCPYLAMEYLPGGSLADKLKESRVPPREAADLVRKLALAVQAAHELQIVHRDLKTANVLFDASGEPRVTDFGLAKKSGSSELTGTNAIMGTPAYMAPEQAKGESKFVGPQADVWALGVILYECLTGTRPFTGSNEIEIIRKVVDQEPTSVRSHDAALPRDLELIVQKCLVKSPADRYPTAGALAEDLRRWLAGEPVSVKAAGPVERTVKWIRRNKLAAGILAASVLGTAVATGLAVWAYRESQRADRQTALSQKSETIAINASRAAQESAWESKNKSEALLEQARETRRLLDLRRLRDAQTFYNQDQIPFAEDALETVAAENRCSAWGILKRLCEGSLYTAYGHKEAIRCVAWSPDGKTILTGSSDKTIRFWDAPGGECVKVLPVAGEIHSLAWHPNGRQFAAGGTDKLVHIWDATGNDHRSLAAHTHTVNAVAWSPDGTRLASASDDYTLRVWDVATGQNLRVVHLGRVNCVDWAPDGLRIATGDSDKTVRILDATTGAILTKPWDKTAGELDPISGIVHVKTNSNRVFLQPVVSVGWCPNGILFHAADSGGTVKTWNAQNWQVINTYYYASSGRGSVWSPDAGRLACPLPGGRVRIHGSNFRPTRDFKGHGAPVQGIAWSPEGRRLATVGDDRVLRVWDIDAKDNALRLIFPIQSMYQLAWSPDGRSLAHGGNGGIVWIWNATTCVMNSPITDVKARFNSGLAWNPNGTQMAASFNNGTIKVCDVVTGGTVWERTVSASLSNLAWAPDGSRIAGITDTGALGVYRAGTGAPLFDGKSQVALNCVAWSADSKRLAIGSKEKRVSFWDAEANRLLPESIALASPVSHLSWSSDNQRMAVACEDHSVFLIDHAQGNRKLECKGHSKAITSMALTGDGLRLATASLDGTVRIWDARTGQNLLELPMFDATRRVAGDGKAAVSHLAWSLDGKRLACYSDERALWIWDSNPFMPAAVNRVQLSEDIDFAMLPAGLIRIERKIPESERARRLTLQKPDYDWHREEAQQSKYHDQWFSIAFHLRRQLALQPNDAESKKLLAIAEQKLRPRETAPPPRRTP